MWIESLSWWSIYHSLKFMTYNWTQLSTVWLSYAQHVYCRDKDGMEWENLKLAIPNRIITYVPQKCVYFLWWGKCVSAHCVIALTTLLLLKFVLILCACAPRSCAGPRCSWYICIQALLRLLSLHPYSNNECPVHGCSSSVNSDSISDHFLTPLHITIEHCVGGLIDCSDDTVTYGRSRAKSHFQ